MIGVAMFITINPVRKLTRGIKPRVRPIRNNPVASHRVFSNGIKTLWEKYRNKKKIAELTGHDWKTVAKMVKAIEAGEQYPVKKPYPRILDTYKEQILEWIEKEGLNGVRIFEKLCGQGVDISYSAVKDYLALIKRRDEIFVRIETKPGEEAQVDFGYVGLTVDNSGKKRRTWVFNMRLSYSRLDYYEKVYDQRVETFIYCHINAFNKFGAVPEYVKIDNLKAAILDANFYAPVYQEVYKSFAGHYGFKPLPCRVRQPNDKGKVESGINPVRKLTRGIKPRVRPIRNNPVASHRVFSNGIKYVKSNFFLGRQFKDGDDLDRQLENWTNKRCNQRIHGTTRKVPQEVFDNEEKAKLKPLPLEEFKMSLVGTRKVYHDCHISVNYNYYSVPFEYVGKEVDIDMSKKLLRVFYQGRGIAIHPKIEGKGQFSTNINHYPAYKRFSDTEYQEKYQAKMSEVGPYAEQIFFLVVENNPRDWSRPIQGILSLLKNYPKEIVEMACKRALAYGVYQYQIIKNICNNGSYNLPVEFNFKEVDTNEYAKIQA